MASKSYEAFRELSPNGVLSPEVVASLVVAAHLETVIARLDKVIDELETIRGRT